MKNKTSVVVLGSTGMLGSTVGEYFDKNDRYKTFLSYKTPELCVGGTNTFFFDALTFDFDLIPHADYVINCIGCVKQRYYDDSTFARINSEFPVALAEHCNYVGSRLIHITTDCVFSGRRGNYSEIDTPDSTDIYGLSKLSGEPTDCLNIRTSIIGPERRANYSLLEWARSQAGKHVNGYTNHIWNGITSLQYAKVCDTIIQDKMYWPMLRHVFSTTVSKYHMLEVFNKKYDLNLQIEAHEHVDRCDRSLTTVYDFNERLAIPSFEQMMEQL